MSSAPSTIDVSSPAFEGGAGIPARFTCDGEGLSPPISWSGVPAAAREVALVMVDLDAGFTHWLVYGLDPSLEALAQGAVPAGAAEGTNDFGRQGYGGPCPPRGPAHRYRFTVHALSEATSLEPGADSADVARAIEGAGIAQGEVTGTYERAG